MPSIRGGYGYGLYQSGDYGVEGILQESSASLSASSSSNADGYITKQGSASTTVVSASSASANATFSSPAIVASTTVVTSVAEQFVLKESDKFSYGSGAYGYNAFDQEDLQTISIGLSSTSNIAGVRVQSSGATVVASSGSSGDSEKIFQGSAVATPALGIVARGAFSVIGSATALPRVEIDITYIRERNIDGSLSVASLMTASAREMWEPISAESDSWVELSQQATQWQKIA